MSHYLSQCIQMLRRKNFKQEWLRDDFLDIFFIDILVPAHSSMIIAFPCAFVNALPNSGNWTYVTTCTASTTGPQRIIFTINLTNAHYQLVFIDLASKQWHLLDPFGNNYKDASELPAHKLFQWLAKQPLKFSPFPLDSHQNDAHSCAFWCMIFAESIANGDTLEQLNSSAKEINIITERARILKQIQQYM